VLVAEHGLTVYACALRGFFIPAQDIVAVSGKDGVVVEAAKSDRRYKEGLSRGTRGLQSIITSCETCGRWTEAF
jgi:hypothetical protein